MAYFVQKQVILTRSNPTYSRCIADQTRSKYDQPTLYRRPPRCTPAQHTTCAERDYPRPFFHWLKNWSRSPRPLRAGPTNPRCILDQHTLSPIKARSLPIRPFFPERERAGVDRVSGVNGPLPSLCFSDRSENKMGHPGLWLDEIFSTYPLQPLKQVLKVLYQVCVFGLTGKQRWRPWVLIGRDIFHSSLATTERNLTKLDRKQILNVIWLVCVVSWTGNVRFQRWNNVGFQGWNNVIFQRWNNVRFRRFQRWNNVRF